MEQHGKYIMEKLVKKISKQKAITKLANAGSAKGRCLDSLHVVSLAVASGVKFTPRES